MIDWNKICNCIGDVINTDYKAVRTLRISGGYTSQAWHLACQGISDKTADLQHYFVKINSIKLGWLYAAEKTGLTALGSTDTVKAPQVITQGLTNAHSFLVLQYFNLCNDGNHELFGTQLAALHHVQADKFGLEQDNALGLTHQPNSQTDDWIQFWRERRIGFQLDLAAHNGYGGKLQSLGRSILDATPDLLANHQPIPSLLHGDLWEGNYAFLTDGTPVIFDPATYYGDREADIAMTELFGGFDAKFYAAYQAAYPLDTGYATRKNLYNLYHVLNHCNMVSSSYVAQAEGMIRKLLNE